MSRVQVKVRVNTRDAIGELTRIGRGPSPAAHRQFDVRLTQAFLRTQATIHRDTGSLAASGQFEGHSFNHGRWTGEISYGGVRGPQQALFPGPWRAKRPPSHYAYYEWRRHFTDIPGPPVGATVTRKGKGKGTVKKAPIGSLRDGSHAFSDDPELFPIVDQIGAEIIDWMRGHL